VYPAWLVTGARAAFAALSAVSPGAAARVALWAFTTPRRHHRPAWERQIAGRGHRVRVGSNLAAHRWGDGPVVLLVHGWEGRGTQLGRFVDPLVAAGFCVVAVDTPAHGDSSGTRTDLIETTEAVRKVARDLGLLTCVVAHSFGGVVTTLALERGLAAKGVVLIATPSSVADVLGRFADTIGLKGAALAAFRRSLERLTGVHLKDVEIIERVARLTQPALVVHDRGDREVPFHEAERLVARWPGATLVATEGLGHRRILKDEDVIRRIVGFARGL
jgi:pimeloyl-ACP methyl ester carboxylesterase